MDRHFPAENYFPTFEGYTEKDLNTRWHDLEWLKHGYLKYIPEFQFIYCLTRYVSTLGDNSHLVTPPDLQDWPEDEKTELTERQREWGEILIERLLHFMGISYAKFISNQKKYLFDDEKVRGFYTVKWVTDKNDESDPRNNDLHKRLISLAKAPPYLPLSRFIWSDGLVEFDSTLQQIRTRKDVILGRREVIGPFNWDRIKKRSPLKLRPDIIKLLVSIDRARRYYGSPRKAKEGDILYLDDRDSLDELLEQAEKSTEGNEAAGEARKELFKALGLISPKDIQHYNKTKIKKSEHQTKLEDELAKEYKFENRKAKWRNPETNEIEIRFIPNKPEGIDTKNDIPPTGKCVFCGARTREWICYYCENEEEQHIEKFLHPPRPGKKKHKTIKDYFKQSESDKQSTAEIFLSSWSREFVIKPPQVWLTPTPHISKFENGRREFVRPSPSLTTWQFWSDISIGESYLNEEIQSVSIIRPKQIAPTVSSTPFAFVIAGPEQVLYQVEEALSFEFENVRIMSLKVAKEIMNRYGNPRKATGFIGYISMNGFLYPCTQTNIALKIGTSNATVTRSMNTLRKILPDRELPEPTELSILSDVIDNQRNIENAKYTSMTGFPRLSEPLTYPPYFDRKSYLFTDKTQSIIDEMQTYNHVYIGKRTIDDRWKYIPWPKCSCGGESITKMKNGKYHCSEGHLAKEYSKRLRERPHNVKKKNSKDRIKEDSWGESTVTKPKKDARSEVDKCWAELSFDEILSCPREPRCRRCYIRVMTENMKRGKSGALEEWERWMEYGKSHYSIEEGQ